MTDFAQARRLLAAQPPRAAAGFLPQHRMTLYAAVAGVFVWLPPAALAIREWDTLATQLHLGPDFISFYAGSLLTHDGAPARVYDLAAHEAAQKALFPQSGYSWFFYPPVYLLLCWPLALAPYFMSIGAWLAATFATYVAMARKFAPNAVGVAPFLAFPAVMMNATHGQNAFLTCALMGAGVMCLERRPVVAGVLFGLLCFKPQLGLLIPVLLAFAGQWRAFASAGATVFALCLASLAAFGPDTWSAYAAALPEARRVLEDGAFGHEKFQSVFAMLRIAGASVTSSYAAQGAAAAAVAGLLAHAACNSRDSLGCGALMCAGAALATPFVLRYDLMLLAVPLMWLARDAQRTGLRLHEALVATAVFLLPLVPLDFTDSTRLLVAPPVIAALFAAVLKRILQGAK
ncbi:MAG: glycosyltransferase family 87 protein [Beijerinckiaceae bacterium]